MVSYSPLEHVQYSITPLGHKSHIKQSNTYEFVKIAKKKTNLKLN